MLRTEQSVRVLICAGLAIGLGAAPMAASAGDPAPFTEEAFARGIEFWADHTNGDTGRGVAFVDLDNDGDPDVVLLGEVDGTTGIYENDGNGFFTAIVPEEPLPKSTRTASVTAADYDNDGDQDLYIGVYGEFNQLLRNEGSFTFTNVADEAGVKGGDGLHGPATGTCWGDYDNDGWLDLYVSQDPERNYFFHNLGDGTFEEVAIELGVETQLDSPTFQPAFLDYDRDGDHDLFIASDRGYITDCWNHNWFYENQGDGTFVDITESSGTFGCINGMGLAVGDYDNDGLLDLYITNTKQGNPLYMNQGDGTFIDESIESETITYKVGWATTFFDYDNDGYQELYSCNVTTEGEMQPNSFYSHTGSWPTIDVAPILGIDSTKNSMCMATADVDNDGDVDFLLQSWNSYIELWINNEGDANGANFVKLDMQGQGANRFAIGSSIEISAGGMTQYREVAAGSNHKCQNELVQHVGLGAETMIDTATAYWLGGDSRPLSNIPAGERWKIYPTSHLGDSNGNDKWEMHDWQEFEACYGESGGPVTPGCEIFDFDGNWTLDQADKAAMEALVGIGCVADFNDDGAVNVLDFPAFQAAFQAGDMSADINGDGSLNVLDFPAFQIEFAAGC